MYNNLKIFNIKKSDDPDNYKGITLLSSRSRNNYVDCILFHLNKTNSERIELI